MCETSLEELRRQFRTCLNRADEEGEGWLPLMFGLVWAKVHADVKCATALAIELNHKAFAYANDNVALAKAYDRLWKFVDDYVLSSEEVNGKTHYHHFPKSEVEYYIRETD